MRSFLSHGAECPFAGGAAIGKYFFIFIIPPAQYTWVLWLASRLGATFGPNNVVVCVVQILLLLVWPFGFVYIVGPIFTAVVQIVPRFVRWTGRFFIRPHAALGEARVTLLALPDTAVLWWANYFFECQRDLDALLGFFRTAVVEPFGIALAELRRRSKITTLTTSAVAEPLLNKMTTTTYGTSLSTTSPANYV